MAGPEGVLIKRFHCIIQKREISTMMTINFLKIFPDLRYVIFADCVD